MGYEQKYLSNRQSRSENQGNKKDGMQGGEIGYYNES